MPDVLEIFLGPFMEERGHKEARFMKYLTGITVGGKGEGVTGRPVTPEGILIFMFY